MFFPKISYMDCPYFHCKHLRVQNSTLVNINQGKWAKVIKMNKSEEEGTKVNEREQAMWTKIVMKVKIMFLLSSTIPRGV